MARTTLPMIFWQLMDAPSITPGHCAICGRNYPTEKHHMVKRSAGELLDEKGKKRKKPVIQLCGFGNNLKDADGREYCHGLAHANRLHFRYDRGPLEYILLDEPTDYQTAMGMEGWKPVRS